MRVNATTYHTYWPLAHVYLTQPAAKADIISTIDQEQDGHATDQFQTHFQHLLSSGGMSWAFMRKLCLRHCSPPIKSGGLAAEFAVRRHSKMAPNKPFPIRCNEIESTRTGFREDGDDRMIPGLARPGHFVTCLEKSWKSGREVAGGNKNWEGYGTSDLSVKTKFCSVFRVPLTSAKRLWHYLAAVGSDVSSPISFILHDTN